MLIEVKRMEMITMDYAEIINYINHGYEVLSDLDGLLKEGYIRNDVNRKYNIWVDEEGKWIDANCCGWSKYVYTDVKLCFGQVVTKSKLVYHPANLNYLAD